MSETITQWGRKKKKGGGGGEGLKRSKEVEKVLGCFCFSLVVEALAASLEMSDVLTKVPWGLTRGSIERSLTGFNVFSPLLAEFDTNVVVQQNSCTQTVEGEVEKSG